MLAGALDLASSLKDDYVATEHLLIALAGTESGAQRLLTDAGLSEQGLREGSPPSAGTAVTSQDAESTYEALEKYSVDLTALAESGDPRPGDRPRRRDPPRHPGAVPAYQEQPGADRRARRRQDRRRRGPRPAGGGRRRARLLKGRRVLSLDLAAMVAGAKYRGEFEERLRRCSRRSRTPAAR